MKPVYPICTSLQESVECKKKQKKPQKTVQLITSQKKTNKNNKKGMFQKFVFLEKL